MPTVESARISSAASGPPSAFPATKFVKGYGQEAEFFSVHIRNTCQVNRRTKHQLRTPRWQSHTSPFHSATVQDQRRNGASAATLQQYFSLLGL